MSAPFAPVPLVTTAAAPRAAADIPFVADVRALLAAPWPVDATIRAGTAIAGMAARPVPGQRALVAKHFPGKRVDPRRAA